MLQDNDSLKFQLVEAIKTTYVEKSFINSPVVAIDGIIFKYNKAQDTIVLPLKKKDITNIIYLDKGSSSAIYGKKETKPNRKMGNITVHDESTDLALEKAKKAKNFIKIKTAEVK